MEEAEVHSAPSSPPPQSQPLPPSPSPSPSSPSLLPFVDAEEASGAPEDDGLHAAPAPPPAAQLSNDLRDKIVRQVEYYFSDENLPTDKFLLKYVKKDKEGFVPIGLIASFRRMTKLAQDLSVIEAALGTSSQLVVSSDGKKVKRLHPLPDIEMKDAKARTVLVENLPEDYSIEYIQRIFGKIGNIKNMTICDPHSIEESVALRKPEMAISTKLHALIEYETVAAAENAVAALNDEKNWRSGMRVELLFKRMEKFGLIQRGHRETPSESNKASQASEVAADDQKLDSLGQHCKIFEEKEEELLASNKGGRKSRYRNRARGHLQQNSNGHGHGSVSSSSSSGMSKPAPGPRMPDGTRGFTMGRGKPNLSHER